MTYELHPLCTLFPRLSGAEFETLRDDIKAAGLRSPIVLHNGMILDGGNRYRACIEAGVEPRFVQFTGDNLVQFVLSVNLHRRHMTPGQQAAIVASAQDWGRAQPEGRPQKQCNVAPLQTSASRAAESGASLRTQKAADKVAKVSPDLARKVAHGEVSLPKALAQVENKPAKAAPPPAEEDFGPSEQEIFESERAMAADMDRVRLILESDDALAAMTEKCKQQAAMIDKQDWRIRGLVNENADLLRRLKSAMNKLDRIEKQAAA